jgi:hypothetical protein
MMDRPSTLDDRVARAAARWKHAVSSGHRGQLRLQQSQWLLVSSRAVLDRPRPAFRGGIDAVPDEPFLQRRLRDLLRMGILPAIHLSLGSAGPCRVRRDCEVRPSVQATSSSG